MNVLLFVENVVVLTLGFFAIYINVKGIKQLFKGE